VTETFQVGDTVERNTGPWHRTGIVTRRYALHQHPELYEVTWHTQAGRTLDPPVVSRGYEPGALHALEQRTLL
jgi:hypothetical protein